MKNLRNTDRCSVASYILTFAYTLSPASVGDIGDTTSPALSYDFVSGSDASPHPMLSPPGPTTRSIPPPTAHWKDIRSHSSGKGKRKAAT